jgi:UDP-GlcNAc:undecaprenyl-phosphate GlcNAc-1-phosphate transferase
MLFAPFMLGIAAFVLCACALPIARRQAEQWNLYDHPGTLKVHHKPIPRIGGAAMMVSLSFCLMPFAPADWNQRGLALLAFSIVWAVSLADDLKSISPLVRLGSHFVAGVLLWIGGWRLGWTSSTVIDLISTCVFVAFLINAMNLFDGLDGLAAGTAAISTLGFLGILSGATNSFSTLVAWTLLGLCLGMLVHNFPPARIFMGDSGSTLLGVLLAFLSLDWLRVQPESHSIALPLVFLGLPVADAVAAILRRLRTRQSPFAGDRRHFYDLLTQRGWSIGKVLLVSWGTTGVLILVGWFSVETQIAPAVLVVMAMVFAFAAHALGSLRPDKAGSPAHPITVLNSSPE